MDATNIVMDAERIYNACSIRTFNCESFCLIQPYKKLVPLLLPWTCSLLYQIPVNISLIQLHV